MIGRPLIKIALVIALLGFAAFELGSPLITRFQLDGVATDAADNGAQTMFQNRNAEQARAVAAEIVASRDTDLEGPIEVDPATNTVRVTVHREARSLLLKRWSVTRDWYDVEVTATSSKQGV